MTDIERSGRSLAERLVGRTLARLPITPLAVTLAGTALSAGAAVLLGLGHLRWAAGLILLSALSDAADGALARVTARQSDLGAFLDSTLDRYAEVLIGLGLLVYLLRHGGSWLDLVLLFLFLSGSLVFSYARARAQAEGFQGRQGLFSRLVRIVLLALGLLAGLLHVTLWVLAIGVQLSAIHRLVGVCLEARREGAPRPAFSLLRWFKERAAARRALREQADGRPPAP